MDETSFWSENELSLFTVVLVFHLQNKKEHSLVMQIGESSGRDY